jgi:hypothetical protein
MHTRARTGGSQDGDSRLRPSRTTMELERLSPRQRSRDHRGRRARGQHRHPAVWLAGTPTDPRLLVPEGEQRDACADMAAIVAANGVRPAQPRQTRPGTQRLDMTISNQIRETVRPRLGQPRLGHPPPAEPQEATAINTAPPGPTVAAAPAAEPMDTPPEPAPQAGAPARRVSGGPGQAGRHRAPPGPNHRPAPAARPPSIAQGADRATARALQTRALLRPSTGAAATARGPSSAQNATRRPHEEEEECYGWESWQAAAATAAVTKRPEKPTPRHTGGPGRRDGHGRSRVGWPAGNGRNGATRGNVHRHRQRRGP